MTTDTWQDIERNVSVLLAADAFEWPKGHYLEIGFGTRNQHGVQIDRREFVPLVSVEETAEDALERWVEEQLGDRQRNRAKEAERLRHVPMYTRIARPTSFYAGDIAEREAREIDAEALRASVNAGRRRRSR